MPCFNQVSYSHSLRHIKKQATNILWKYSTATELLYLSYPVHGTWLYILCVIINDFHNLWHEQFNNSLLLILSEIHIIKDNKMKKFIHVTKNSDVYLVGNSQICGFEGEYSGQKMNISYSRGAGILDCLAECARQFKAMRGKVRK